MRISCDNKAFDIADARCNHEEQAQNFWKSKTAQCPRTKLLNSHTSTNIHLLYAASVMSFKKILEEEVTVFWILKIHMAVTYIHMYRINFNFQCTINLQCTVIFIVFEFA